jgi:hypothetical protein
VQSWEKTTRKERNNVNKLASSNSIGAFLLLGFTSVLSAQLKSSVQSITVTAQAAESISITIISGGTVNFAIPGVGSSSTGSVVPSWTTSWVLSSSRTSVKVYAYFFGSPALMGIHGNTIPGGSFSGQANGGALTSFSTAGVSDLIGNSSGMLVSTTAITSGNLTGNKTDSLALSLFGGVQATDAIAADTYSGSLLIQAQATP